MVIDMQVGLFGSGRKSHDPEGVVARINQLIRAVRRADGAVVFIQDDGASPDSVIAKGTPGWAIRSDLNRDPADPVVEKPACDSFLETDLAEVLARLGDRELIMTGCCTEFCVDTTVRSAAGRGYEVTVVEDGHTTADKPYLDAAMIIRHHNQVWRNLDLPRGRIRVVPTARLIKEIDSAG